jgi:hypothetical protein
VPADVRARRIINSSTPHQLVGWPIRQDRSDSLSVLNSEEIRCAVINSASQARPKSHAKTTSVS